MATVSEDDCDCIKEALCGKEPAWMGLHSLQHDTSSFKFVDGSDCPNKGKGKQNEACLRRQFWNNHKPISFKHGGSQCVGIGGNGLMNDIACTDTRNAILCNIGSGETTTASPTTAEPTTSEPTTAEPTTAEPTTYDFEIICDGIFLC